MTLSHFATTVPTPAPGKAPVYREGVQVLDFKVGDSLPTHRTTRALMVTPAIAADLLARYADPKKRRIRPKVKAYAASMTRGQWRDDRTIEFTQNGSTRLSDGHHRLTAIVMSGVTVWFTVLLGRDERDRWIEGIRISRSPADMLTMEGCTKYATAIASAAKITYLYDNASALIPWDEDVIPDAEDIVLTYLEDRPLWDATMGDLAAASKRFPDGSSRQAIQAAGILIEKRHPGAGVSFIESLARYGGPTDGRGETLHSVLSTLIRDKKHKASGGGSREPWARAVLAMVILAFNASLAGTSWKRPEFGPGGRIVPLPKIK